MRNATERHFDELKAAGLVKEKCLCGETVADAEMLAAMTDSPLDAREAVRQLHVLYGIAMTNKLTDDYDYIRSVYGQLASDIHRVLLGITNENDPETELRWLASKWREVARTSDGRTTALFGSWAQNVEGMIG